ncbi:MAG: hypothetical protein AAF639_10750 [Chloroflexota bacterium]
MANNKTKSDPIDWHRLLGLVLAIIFERLSYTTEVEVDVSRKKQLVDIIAVRKEEEEALAQRFAPLPPEYWEVFGELNQHNLISFKSYSESFNAPAHEEFLGHLSDYCKNREVKREDVNLYVITHHYPQSLLKNFRAKGFVTVVKEDEIYDLDLDPLKKVRFIVCRVTGHPVLGLFSDDEERIVKSFDHIFNETDLFEETTTYLGRISDYIAEVMGTMYTEADFIRDYPRREGEVNIFTHMAKMFTKNRQEGRKEGRYEGMRISLLNLIDHRYQPSAKQRADIEGQLQQIDSSKIFNDLTNVCLEQADIDNFQEVLDTYIPDFVTV